MSVSKRVAYGCLGLALFLGVTTVPAMALFLGQAAFQFSARSAVASGSQTQSVSVSLPTGGTIGTVLVTTQGKAQGDFTAISGGTCAAGAIFLPTTSCTVQVHFAPLAPGERHGAIVLTDGSGTLLATRLLYGIGTGSAAVLVPPTMQTIAGNGTWIYRNDGDLAINSSIFLPGGVAVDGNGNVFLSDTSNNRVRRVDASSQIISTVAGTGTPGFAGDGGQATAAAINLPSGMVIDGAGNVLFADSGNNVVRKLTVATGMLTTLAGQLGQSGSSGDGSLATAALLNSPEGIALDAAGDIYVADTYNATIRRIDAVTGIISTVAGTPGMFGSSGDGGRGTSAVLNTPWGIAFDSAGNLYIADVGTNTVRMLSAGGTISTFAGTGTPGFNGDGAAATATNLKGAAAVAVDVAGNVYIADSGNNLIRKVAAGTALVSTVAGSGSATFTGDGGPATMAGMYGPYALAVDSSANLFFSDIFHHRIRELQNTLNVLKFDPIRVGRTSSPQPVTVENDGNAPLNFIAIAPDTNSAFDPGTTTCAAGSALVVDATCVVGAEFAPQVTGTPATAVLSITSDASNSPATVSMSGESDALDPTTTILNSGGSPAALGLPVTFTATIRGTGTTAPQGNVRFFDGTTLLATVASTGVTATYTTSSLTLGTHPITAAFTGDAANSPSTSVVLNQIIRQTPTVSLSASAPSTRVGESLTFTATVTGPSVAPTGAVAFIDGSRTLGNGTLNASGVAVFTTTALAAGTHNIVASYPGDTNTLFGNSATLSQPVVKWSSVTTLSTSASTLALGTSVTFSIHVTPTSTVALSAGITLLDGATTIATLTPDAQGNASYATTALIVGAHSLTATYAGDATNDTSTSTAVAETVQTITTATALSSSANPVPGQANLTLTAQVTPASTNTTAGSLTGTVIFMEGANTLGTGTLSPTGAATFSTTTLAVGSHTITAVYGGNTGYATSTSAALVQTVQLATTTAQLTTSANPIISGNALTVSVALSGTGSTPSGTVTFFDGSASLGIATLNAAGQASLALRSLTAGSHSLTAVYAGDASDSTTTSAAVVEVVQQATTHIALGSAVNPSYAGATLVFAAALTSNGSLPTGALTLHEGGNVLGTAALAADGTASFSVTSLLAGSHTLVASFAGDADHTASDSTALVQVVQTGTSTATVTSSGSPSIFGDAVTFSILVSGTIKQPTGSVALMDGVATIATLTLNGPVVTYTTTALAIGDHVITAIYGGDDTHAGSTSATITERVRQATQVALASSEMPSVVGDSVRLTATITGVSGATVSGAVTFADGASVLGIVPISGGAATLTNTTLTAGGHVITATYSGDATSQGSASPAFLQTVNTAGTTISLASSANPSITGAAVTFTATVGSSGKAASGTVTFMDGTATIGTANVNAGVATFTTKGLTAGTHAIVARYGGDDGTQVSTSGILFQVDQQKTTLGLVSSVNPALTVQGIVLTATLGNGAGVTGVITFTDRGAAIGSVSVDSTGIAVLSLPSLAAGSHTLDASYSGDKYNLPSSTADLIQTVQLRATSTSTTASSDTYASGQAITLVGVVMGAGAVAPTGAVVFTSGGAIIGTAQLSAAGAATLTFYPLADKYTVVATYAGDGVYAGSAAGAYTITAGPSTTFSLTPSVTSLSLASGSHFVVDLTMTSVKGFTDTLALGCLELPDDATCTFSSDKMLLAANGTGVVHLTIDTGNPLGIGTLARLHRPDSGQTSAPILAAAVFFPALALFLLPVWSRGRRLAPRLLSVILLLTLAAGGLSGCANKLTSTTTPAGSYTIRIVASGTQSGASRVVDLPLTVTK